MSRHEARSPLYLRVDALSNLQENTGGSFMIIRRDVQRREYTVLLRNHVGEELGVLVWPFDAQLTVESAGSVVRSSASALHEFGSGSGEVSGPRDLGRSWGTETLRDWGPTCKVRILDGRRIQLREEPRSGSLPGRVTFGERDPIEAIGWDVVNGYMHVRAGIEGCYMQGWIPIQHIVAWDDRRLYRALEDESWYQHHWKVTTSDMAVWVNRGGRSWEEIANELIHMGEADKDERKHLRKLRDMVMAGGYT